MVCILRVFSYYRFQDKLNVLTRTFQLAWIQLYHFCAQLFATFVLIAFIGYFLFGSCNLSYSTVSMALTSVLQMTINDYDLPSLRRGSFLADPYLLLITIFVAQIWFGCLMAILMSSFTGVCVSVCVWVSGWMGVCVCVVGGWVGVGRW
jgi:hypothetical protein